MIPIHKPIFALGRLTSTPGALEALQESGQTPWFFLSRHVAGDWGDLSDEDRRLNDEAVKDGSRILSAFRTLKGKKVWIITEADRNVTTLLLPEEY
jgi:hypothetical protein